MKLTIRSSANGWLVIANEGRCGAGSLEDEAKSAFTFNSLDKAIAHIRKTLKSWHDPKNPKSPIV